MVAQLPLLSKSRTLTSSPQKMPSGLILSLPHIHPPPPPCILALCSQWRHTVWPLSGACLAPLRQSVFRPCVFAELVAHGFGLFTEEEPSWGVLSVCRVRHAPPQAFKARLLFSATWWPSRVHARRINLESVLFQMCFMLSYFHQTWHSVSAMFCKNELRSSI